LGQRNIPNHRNPPPGREAFTRKEWGIIQKHRTPKQVQDFLRSLPYNWEEGGATQRTFRGVVKHGEVQCLEGALTAAAILEQHGYPPLLLDLESQDGLGHTLFLFQHKGRYGTVARSRDAGLHGRKPVYRTLLKLVKSYADPFVDWTGRLTHWGVYDLRRLRGCGWRLSTRNVWKVERMLLELRHKRFSFSDRRYRALHRQYLSFRKRYPDRPVTYYNSQPQWL
jgi:hypothetical protein